ncbi:MAG: SDR family oxidoreductase [Undibacterium sp.]|nr:SDR family oxidoreductase [Undibacterium sp.]
MNPAKIPSRVALVTGAAKRLGRHIAIMLAQRGWDIVVHYGASQSEAQQVVAEIQAHGQHAIALPANLADEEQVRGLLAQALLAFGRVDCVVNNASLFDADTAHDFSQQKLDQHMHVNLMAPVLLAQGLYQATAHGRQACIINILDQKLYNLNPDYLSYTLSKAALQCATTTLAQALAPRVRVVGLAPGLSLRSGEQSESDFQIAHQMTPLGKSSSPDDIAHTVCFIADSPAITGTTIVVDGGQHLIPTARDVMFLAKAE